MRGLKGKRRATANGAAVGETFFIVPRWPRFDEGGRPNGRSFLAQSPRTALPVRLAAPVEAATRISRYCCRWYTGLPSIQVESTWVSLSWSIGHSRKSRSITTKSARLPGSSDPISSSMNIR